MRGVVTVAGREKLLEKAFGYPPPSTTFRYVAFGSGDSPPSIYDSGLQAEFMRIEGSVRLMQSKAIINASFVSDANYVVREVGIFDDPNAGEGTMLFRAVLDAPQYLESGDIFYVTITIYIR